MGMRTVATSGARGRWVPGRADRTAVSRRLCGEQSTKTEKTARGGSASGTPWPRVAPRVSGIPSGPWTMPTAAAGAAPHRWAGNQTKSGHDQHFLKKKWSAPENGPDVMQK